MFKRTNRKRTNRRRTNRRRTNRRRTNRRRTNKNRSRVKRSRVKRSRVKRSRVKRKRYTKKRNLIGGGKRRITSPKEAVLSDDALEDPVKALEELKAMKDHYHRLGVEEGA